MVNALLHRLGRLPEAAPSGLNRIVWTAALPAWVVARNDAAHRSGGEQFRARSVRKTCIALPGRVSCAIPSH
jgi:hypothetical protein